MHHTLYLPLWRKLVTYFMIISLLKANLIQAMENNNSPREYSSHAYTSELADREEVQEQQRESSLTIRLPNSLAYNAEKKKDKEVCASPPSALRSSFRLDDMQSRKTSPQQPLKRKCSSESHEYRGISALYKEGKRIFKGWSKAENSNDLPLRAEEDKEALYKAIYSMETLNFPYIMFVRRWLNESYIKSIMVLKEQDVSDPFSNSRRKGLAFKCNKFLSSLLEIDTETPDKKGIEIFLIIVQYLESIKATASIDIQLSYAHTISRVYIKLCDFLITRENNKLALGFKQLLIEIKKSLHANLKKLEELLSKKDNDINLHLINYFPTNHNLIILSCYNNIRSPFVLFKNIDYSTSFHYFYHKIINHPTSFSFKEDILRKLEDLMINFWDVLILPPFFSQPPIKIHRFFRYHSQAYPFFLATLERKILEKKEVEKKGDGEKQKASCLGQNLSPGELSARLKNFMVYYRLHCLDKPQKINKTEIKKTQKKKAQIKITQKKIKQLSLIIGKTLSLLANKDVLSLAGEIQKDKERRRLGISDILLCAHYAACSDNPSAFNYAFGALKSGSFDNIEVISNAPFIDLKFRKAFFRKSEIHETLLAMIEHKQVSIKNPEVLAFLATSYYLGSTVFPVDHPKSSYWSILALKHNSTEASYILVNILWGKNKPKKGEDRGSVLFYENLIKSKRNSRYIAQLHLARLFVEEGKKDECIGGQKAFYSYQRAFSLLSESLSNEKIGSEDRENYVWYDLLQTRRYRFSDSEKILLRLLDNEKNSRNIRAQAAYDLGCLHMWGGYKEEETLYQALYYFGIALRLGVSESDFFLTAIRYNLSDLHWESKLHIKNPHGAPKWIRNALKKADSQSSKNTNQALMINNGPLRGAKISAEDIKKNFPLLCQNGFSYMGLLPALCSKYGIEKTTYCVENSIEWLIKTALDDKVASYFLETMYPAFQLMNKRKYRLLNKHRLYTDGRPKIAIIGGGITGIMCALLLNKLKKKDGSPLFDIHLFEKGSQLLDGASKLISRLHLGGEYPKHEKTGRQCLLSAILFRQMFQTEFFLTRRKAIDFLVAKASPNTPRNDHNLNADTLLEHYEKLKLDYREYYDAIKTIWGDETADKLFGSPEKFVQFLSQENIEELNIGNHFAAGLHTPERGFQPVDMGIMLEHLLKKASNITIHRASEISKIKSIENKGFKFKISSPTLAPSTFYTKFIVNASWAGVPYINSLVNKNVPGSMRKNTEINVYLRSMALIDISDCPLPSDRSFFGLFGEHGGMLSCFNLNAASIFIPKEGLSYHGKYPLDERGVLTNTLPTEACQQFTKLCHTNEKKNVGEAILANAKTKYTALENAKFIDLITRTTLTREDEIHKRSHDNAHWVDKNKRCLEAYSSKGSFSIFAGLQSLARFSILKKFSTIAQPFLPKTQSFIKEIFFEGDHFVSKTAILPEELILVKDENDLPPAEQLPQLRRKYVFDRHLPMTLIDDENSADLRADMSHTEKFDLIEWGTEIDIEHFILTPDLVNSLLGRIKEGIVSLKLGKVLATLRSESAGNRRIYNASEIAKQREQCLKILEKIASISTLESLSLHNWDLDSTLYVDPLKSILSRLKSFTLTQGSISKEVAPQVFSIELNIERLTLLNLTDSALPVLHIIDHIANSGFPRLQELTIAYSDKHLADTLPELERMIASHPSLKRLSFRSKNASSTSSDPTLQPYIMSFILSICRAKNLEYVDFRGNKYLRRFQDKLDYYFAYQNKMSPNATDKNVVTTPRREA